MPEQSPADLIRKLQREVRTEAEKSGSKQLQNLAVDIQDVSRKTPAGARSVVNSAARLARTTLINSIHGKVNLTKTQVRNRTSLKLAGPVLFGKVQIGTAATASAIVGGDEPITERSKGETKTRKELKGQRISLFEFGRPRWNPRKPHPLGAAVQISRTSTTFISEIAGRTKGRGFIRTMPKSGKAGVFSRSIKSLQHGSIPLVKEIVGGKVVGLRADKRFNAGARRKGRLPIILLRGPSVAGVLQGNESLIVHAEALSRALIRERLVK